VIQIDDCIIKNGQPKCDYLFINCDDMKLYFVELKGRHSISYAVTQIYKTVIKFKGDSFYKESKSIDAFVVSRKRNTPKITTSEKLNVDIELKAKGGRLLFKELTYTLGA
ncbi:MAG: hypothetical protein L7F77_16415, partial [Candidatus Magnetominusculus sp. LBB02]|nr:hypothetical protein [Candidatus Magnetominusculus sp. LBB02]